MSSFVFRLPQKRRNRNAYKLIFDANASKPLEGP